MNQCGSCTECCKGWVTSTVNDEYNYPGSPCKHLKDTGCSIYKARPEDPCKAFRCEFLQDKDFPFWMRPDNIKAIVMHKKIGDIHYHELVECGEKLDSTALEFFFQKYLSGQYTNIRYRIFNHPRNIGTQEFIDALAEAKL